MERERERGKMTIRHQNLIKSCGKRGFVRDGGPALTHTHTHTHLTSRKSVVQLVRAKNY